jgi:hypothetical protein
MALILTSLKALFTADSGVNRSQRMVAASMGVALIFAALSFALPKSAKIVANVFLVLASLLIPTALSLIGMFLSTGIAMDGWSALILCSGFLLLLAAVWILITWSLWKDMPGAKAAAMVLGWLNFVCGVITVLFNLQLAATLLMGIMNFVGGLGLVYLHFLWRQGEKHGN